MLLRVKDTQVRTWYGYSGHPSAGRFSLSACFTAFSHLALTFTRVGEGPFLFLFAVFILCLDFISLSSP